LVYVVASSSLLPVRAAYASAHGCAASSSLHYAPPFHLDGAAVMLFSLAAATIPSSRHCLYLSWVVVVARVMVAGCSSKHD